MEASPPRGQRRGTPGERECGKAAGGPGCTSAAGASVPGIRIAEAFSSSGHCETDAPKTGVTPVSRGGRLKLRGKPASLRPGMGGDKEAPLETAVLSGHGLANLAPVVGDPVAQPLPQNPVDGADEEIEALLRALNLSTLFT